MPNKTVVSERTSADILREIADVIQFPDRFRWENPLVIARWLHGFAATLDHESEAAAKMQAKHAADPDFERMVAEYRSQPSQGTTTPRVAASTPGTSAPSPAQSEPGLRV